MLRSVRSRVIALAVGVAAVAVLLTAWLATQSAEQTIRDNATQSLENDAAIYQALVDYGVTHQDWNDAGPLLAELAQRYDRRVAITDQRGRLLQDSDRSDGGESRALPAAATAQLDPLNPALSQYGVAIAIDAPVSVTFPEDVLADALKCLDAEAVPYVLVDNGGALLPQPTEETDTSPAGTFWQCTDPVFGVGEAVAEGNAGADYDAMLAGCVTAAGFTPVIDEFGVSLAETTPEAFAALDRCFLDAARASVAPPVLLYLGTVTDLDPFGGPSFWRTLAIAAGILALAGAAAWWLGRRLTKPLVQLTDAAGRLEAGEFGHRVPSDGTDELGVLSHAFNSLATSLQRNEDLRRQMVSDIAHELRNPLVTINGTLEAIEDGVYEPTPAVMSSLAEEAEHLTRLVRDLQELATADAGGLRVQRAAGDLGEVTAAVVDAHQAVARAAGVALIYSDEREPGAPLVLLDASRMRQVLDNLVVNALRHTPDGGEIAVVVGADWLCVTDTGEGIAADDLPHVFERFWRADPSRTRATGGSGLGLAIAKELVAAHGATLSAESTYGEGATFRIRGLQPAE